MVCSVRPVAPDLLPVVSDRRTLTIDHIGGSVSYRAMGAHGERQIAPGRILVQRQILRDRTPLLHTDLRRSSQGFAPHRYAAVDGDRAGLRKVLLVQSPCHRVLLAAAICKVHRDLPGQRGQLLLHHHRGQGLHPDGLQNIHRGGDFQRLVLYGSLHREGALPGILGRINGFPDHRQLHLPILAHLGGDCSG